MASNETADAGSTGDFHTEAATLPVEEMIARVDSAQARLAKAVMALSDEEFDGSAAPGGRNGRGILRAFVKSNMRSAQQVLYVALSGELPPGEPVDIPDDRDALLADSNAAIESLWVHVREADPNGFLDTRWRHPVYGELTWRGWLLSLEMLADEYAKQLEEMHHA